MLIVFSVLLLCRVVLSSTVDLFIPNLVHSGMI